MLRIWGIKNCNSVKKALEFLDSRGVNHEFIDYKKNTPSVEQIKKWVDRKGIEVVLNTKGTTYKKLNLKDLNLSLEEMIEYMNQNPTLIKRPILETQEDLEFGFGQEKYGQIL